MCKAEYMSMYAHPSGKYLKRAPHVWEKIKWCIFCHKSRVQSQLFGNFTAPAQHSNVQVSIFMTCLNFAGTGSWILLRSVSSSRRVIPSWKFTLNFNGEISYRELVRRPCYYSQVGKHTVYLTPLPLVTLLLTQKHPWYLATNTATRIWKGTPTSGKRTLKSQCLACSITRQWCQKTLGSEDRSLFVDLWLTVQ